MCQAQFKSMYFPILILNFSRLGRTSGEIKDVRDLRMSEVQRLRKTHKIIGRHRIEKACDVCKCTVRKCRSAKHVLTKKLEKKLEKLVE